jgi:hypothetical protein
MLLSLLIPLLLTLRCLAIAAMPLHAFAISAIALRLMAASYACHCLLGWCFSYFRCQAS